MIHKFKLIAFIFILLAIPLTVILAQRVQNFINLAAEPDRKMVMGISIQEGEASKDGREDITLAAIDTLARPINQGGIGQYPGTFSIWTSFAEGGWQYGPRSKFPSTKLLNGLHQRHITPVIFMTPVGPNTSNISIASGAWDTYLREWANAANNYDKPIIFRYAWEMNGNWFPWSPGASENPSNTAANYITAWKHVYDVIKPIAPKVKFYWCPHGTGNVTELNSFFPGVNYVDYVGFDLYERSSNTRTMSQLYKPTINAIRQLPNMKKADGTSVKPIIVGETGALTGVSSRKTWLANGYPDIYAQFPDVKAIIYFNLDMNNLWGVRAEPGVNWHLNAAPEMRSAYANIASQAKFQGRFAPYSAPPPSLTPTKAPTPTPTPSSNPAPATTLNLTNLKLHGIGKGGDNINPNGTGNNNPLTPTRSLTVELYNASGALVASAVGNITYTTTTREFTGTIKLPSTINSGSYLVKIKSSQLLRRQLPGVINIVKGTTNQGGGVSLVTGDINGDQRLTLLDFNILKGCYSDLLPPKDCTPEKKAASDITNDGKVNQDDFSLYIRELSVIAGD